MIFEQNDIWQQTQSKNINSQDFFQGFNKIKNISKFWKVFTCPGIERRISLAD